jgi:putative DNA primase/helicase
MTAPQISEGAEAWPAGASLENLLIPNDEQYGVTEPGMRALISEDPRPVPPPLWEGQETESLPPATTPALPPRQQPASTPYVDADPIKKAADGRETEVIDALGIPWRSGHPHILCPYPSHADHNPSWRWDKAEARAFCSCTGGQAESVFDVVMKIEGIDFLHARLRVAEILRLDDLVKTGSAVHNGAWHLNPPASVRDDDLVRAYVAHRLGVPAADVLMPTTPVAGWKSLGYYDSKTDHVGDYPCAVFGLVNPEGRVHAHRIYVQPGGGGKAKLPKRADGSERDIKKAVYLPKPDHIDGRCVVWGDASKAKTFIVGEGIETMAAVAQAYRVEIEQGDIVVVAACSTAWLKSWRTWPAAKRVVIAADRDEDRPRDDAGYKAGAKAAKKLAAGLAKTGVQVAIALPGKEGTDTDWLDVHISGGADAVLAGIAEAKLVEVEAVEPAPAPVSIATPGSANILILDRRAHMNSACEFLRRNYQLGDKTTMQSQSGMFYEWDGHCYPESDRKVVNGQLWQFLDRAMIRDEGNKLENYLPDLKLVANVMAGVEAKTILHRKVQAPAWLDDGADMPAASELVACRNGLLHLPTRELYPHTPDFWTHNALDYDFQPDAPEPKQWMALLQQIWSNDKREVDLDVINALQEMFGYCLSADTSQQKIFLLVGPKRSGKGTIGRVLTRLLGPENVGSPTLHGLCTQFGLQPLIGKSAAIIGDARIGYRHDQAAITERLLSISGEDSITIDRKNFIAWTGRLGVRFVILTNELPRVSDTSGALASRFIVLRFVKSFADNPDTGLSDRLMLELPGILNWAIEGWVNLQKRGHFVQPQSSIDAVEEMEDIGSPVLAFVRDRCIIDPAAEENIDELFKEWCHYCGEESRREAGTKAIFGRDLRTAVPAITIVRRRDDENGDRRIKKYQGVRLASAI